MNKKIIIPKMAICVVVILSVIAMMIIPGCTPAPGDGSSTASVESSAQGNKTPDNATRWMALEALMELIDESVDTSLPHPYTDVSADASYNTVVQWGYDCDITDKATTFRPEDEVTYKELAGFIYNFSISLKGVDKRYYTDAVDYCTKKGILDKTDDTVVTTGEVTTIMAELKNYFSEKESLGYEDFQNIEFDEDNIVLSFAAMSDVHIDSLEKNTAATHYENALNIAYEFSNDDLDMVFIAGDVVQNLMFNDIAQERLYEIDAFKTHTDNFLREGTAFVFCTGNHDRSSAISYEQNFYDVFTATEEDVKRYYSYDVVEDCDYEKGNRHAVVNGYHFLSVGMYQDYVSYLAPILTKLTEEDPFRPIFVQYHFHAEDTVYETFYSDSTEQAAMKQLLDNYPQVVYFSGHTHNGLENPRAIWQGTFTALDTASVRELTDDSLINYGIKIPINATHSEVRTYATEATLVQVDKDNNIRFTCYNTHRGDIIAQYTIAGPNEDKTHLLTYSDAREAYSEAPVFPEGSEFTIERTFSGDLNIEFDTATHEDIVWYYTITFTAQGEEEQKFYFTSRYFDPNGMPDVITTTLYKDAHIPDNDNHKGMGHNLTEDVTYTATLTPYDVWDHAGDPIVIEYAHKKGE